MFAMFKKVAAKERICGFYSTGPKIRENDLAIAELFKWVGPLFCFISSGLNSGLGVRG